MELYIPDHLCQENIYFGKYYLLTVVPNYLLSLSIVTMK